MFSKHKNPLVLNLKNIFKKINLPSLNGESNFLDE